TVAGQWPVPPRLLARPRIGQQRDGTAGGRTCTGASHRRGRTLHPPSLHPPFGDHPMTDIDAWSAYGETLNSRLLLGTALYPSPEVMKQAILASEAEVITVSLRRQAPADSGGKSFWDYIGTLGKRLLPNTAGCHSAREAVATAQMSREIFQTNWIKLEVIGDDYNLQPDPFQLLAAAETLIKDGFAVFPYCTDDLVLCQRLVAVGCRVLMPWGAPI